MKKALMMILLITFAGQITRAQKTQHYLSYNFSGTLFFKPYARASPLLSPLLTPSLSYYIQKGHYGLALFSTFGVVNYEEGIDKAIRNHVGPEFTTAVSYLRYSLSGLTVHYALVNKSWVTISPNAGLAFVWYKADTKEVYRYSDEYSDVVSTREEMRLGALLGLNALFPVYKNWYINTNIRYFEFPFASYNKRNLEFEVGIGYAFRNDICSHECPPFQ